MLIMDDIIVDYAPTNEQLDLDMFWNRYKTAIVMPVDSHDELKECVYLNIEIFTSSIANKQDYSSIAQGKNKNTFYYINKKKNAMMMPNYIVICILLNQRELLRPFF